MSAIAPAVHEPIPLLVTGMSPRLQSMSTYKKTDCSRGTKRLKVCALSTVVLITVLLCPVIHASVFIEIRANIHTLDDGNDESFMSMDIDDYDLAAESTPATADAASNYNEEEGTY